MDSAEPAEKVAALEAELSSKSSRIAELEARVSLLEAENADLRRRAMAKGGAPDLTGEEDPIVGRLEDSSGAHKQTPSEKPGEPAGCDVLVLSDDDVGIAIDADKGRSPEVLLVTRENDEVEGGSQSNKGEARCDSNVSLEDDDVSVTPLLRKKRSAARVVTSDSEDEDMGICEFWSGDDDQEGAITRSRKHALHQVSDSENEDDIEAVDVSGSKRAPRLLVKEMENEDEDDSTPISQVLKKIRKERVSDDDDELGDTHGSSTPTTRRSARLVKKRQAAPRVLNFVEPKEYEGSEDDTDEDDMNDFINDGDPSEDNSDSAEASCAEPELSGGSAVNEESSPELEESDIVVDYKQAMACIGRKKKHKDWILEGDMLAAFRENPELCLKAVCALYRKQTKDEQLEKLALFHNKQGFSHAHATRGSLIADFLLDGDPQGPLKKTVDDLEEYDCSALGFCQMVASHYSKQLFAIYQNKEDPYFHP